MTDASPPDRTDVWGQILVEARELRSKQDLRLTALQRQSQVVVAGFLAISAIVAAAVSSLQADPARAAERIIPVIWAVLAFAAINGYLWFRVHRISSQWNEAPNIDYLVHAFQGRVNGLAPLQRHLVRIFTEDFHDNELTLRRIAIRVGAQTLFSLLSIYIFAVSVLAVL